MVISVNYTIRREVVSERTSCCCKCFPFIAKFFKKKKIESSGIIAEKEMQQNFKFLNLLPTEIILEVSKYLPVRDLVNFRATSKRQYQILDSSSLIWCHVLVRDFPSKAKVLEKKDSPYEAYKREFKKAKELRVSRHKVEHFHSAKNYKLLIYF